MGRFFCGKIFWKRSAPGFFRIRGRRCVGHVTVLELVAGAGVDVPHALLRHGSAVPCAAERLAVARVAGLCGSLVNLAVVLLHGDCTLF